jgi:SAM-dependent methyltransferase
MIRAMETLAVACSGVELGLFEALDGDGVDWRELCRGQEYDCGAMETLLNGLTATGFFAREGEVYRLTDKGRCLRDDPFLADYLLLAKVYTVMFRYPERVRNNYLHKLGTGELKIITALGKHSAQTLIECLSDMIPSLVDQPLDVVDIGCGQGYHLAELASRNPRLRCRGIDADGEILRRARRVLESRGLEGITLQVGDMRTVPLGEDVDLIACFTALRGMGPDESIQLARRIYRALKPGGYFVVHDFFLEDSGLEPLDNVFFDMKLALAAKGARVLRRKDFEGFKAAGFREYRMKELTGSDLPVQGSALFLYRK